MTSIRENYHVILKKGTNMKIVKLSRNGTTRFDKKTFVLNAAIGKPFGTTWEVQTGQIVPVESSQTASVEIAKSGDDNRDLKDDTLSQKLQRDDIASLKEQGVTGEGIIERLVDNSASFENKTSYSQAKYLKRKADRHLRPDSLAQILTHTNIQSGSKVIIIEHCQGLLVAAALERLGGKGHIVHFHTEDIPVVIAEESFDFPAEYTDIIMRMQLQYFYKVLKVGEKSEDQVNTNGGKEEAVAAKVHEATVLQTPKTAQTQVKTVANPQTETSTQSQANVVTQPPAESVTKPQAEAVTQPQADIVTQPPAESVTQHKAEIVTKPQAEAVTQPQAVGGTQPQAETVTQPQADRVTQPQADVVTQPQVEGAQPQVESSQKRKRNYPPNAERAQRRMKRQETNQKIASVMNEKEMDALIIACRFRPAPLLTHLLEYLAPSRPFVVYSNAMEPLVECYDQLKGSGDVVSMQLTETWLREYQVLENRTHPLVNMSGSGGYILTGIKVVTEV